MEDEQRKVMLKFKSHWANQGSDRPQRRVASAQNSNWSNSSKLESRLVRPCSKNMETSSLVVPRTSSPRLLTHQCAPVPFPPGSGRAQPSRIGQSAILDLEKKTLCLGKCVHF